MPRVDQGTCVTAFSFFLSMETLQPPDRSLNDAKSVKPQTNIHLAFVSGLVLDAFSASLKSARAREVRSLAV